MERQTLEWGTILPLGRKVHNSTWKSQTAIWSTTIWITIAGKVLRLAGRDLKWAEVHGRGVDSQGPHASHHANLQSLLWLKWLKIHSTFRSRCSTQPRALMMVSLRSIETLTVAEGTKTLWTTKQAKQVCKTWKLIVIRWTSHTSYDRRDSLTSTRRQTLICPCNWILKSITTTRIATRTWFLWKDFTKWQMGIEICRQTIVGLTMCPMVYTKTR